MPKFPFAPYYPTSTVRSDAVWNNVVVHSNFQGFLWFRGGHRKCAHAYGVDSGPSKKSPGFGVDSGNKSCLILWWIWAPPNAPAFFCDLPRSARFARVACGGHENKSCFWRGYENRARFWRGHENIFRIWRGFFRCGGGRLQGTARRAPPPPPAGAGGR